MVEDQKYILIKILNIVDEEQPDGVLIAGDVYDKSVPSEEAMQLWDEFLVNLVKRGLQVFAISGNHDSAVRFSDHNTLVDATGVHLSPVYSGKVEPYVLQDAYGLVNIYMLPFIKPAIVRECFPEETINDYTDACRVAISHMQVQTEERNVILAHQFLTGAARSESEELVVGGLDNVSAEVFDDFDYVALGHIHGQQQLGRKTIRYCGTPLKYSFSEKDQEKSVTVIELGEKGQVDIRTVPLVPYRDMREICGTYQELTARKNYEGTNQQDYIHAVLTDEEDILDALGKLRVIYPNIMKLSYDNKRTRENREISQVNNVETKTPIQLFEEFFELQNNQTMSEEQRNFTIELMESIWEV
jgi:exonuclease SbcD